MSPSRTHWTGNGHVVDIDLTPPIACWDVTNRWRTLTPTVLVVAALLTPSTAEAGRSVWFTSWAQSQQNLGPAVRDQSMRMITHLSQVFCAELDSGFVQSVPHHDSLTSPRVEAAHRILQLRPGLCHGAGDLGGGLGGLGRLGGRRAGAPGKHRGQQYRQGEP